jgi:tripartite-type tricarboxylate transporter receptor subunit TctC
MKSIPYDPVADFAPISRVGVLPFLLVISSGHSISSVKELIAYAKANPGKLSYASANATGHVAGAMFAQMAGIDMLHVPFKTTANAMTNVLNGEVSIMFMDIPPALGQISAEKLRPLGVTTARRTSLLPQVPSIAEAPLPGFELIAWTALCAPAGTSSQIVNRLNVEIVKVLADPEVKKILAKIGIEAVSSTPEEASAYIRAERERWAQLVRTAGIQPE